MESGGSRLESFSMGVGSSGSSVSTEKQKLSNCAIALRGLGAFTG